MCEGERVLEMGGRQRVVRVLPDVAAIDKEFDYLVPDGVEAQVGDVVRIELHGRRVGGWIVAVDVEETRLSLARSLGAAHAVLGADAPAVIAGITEGAGADVVLDLVGSQATIDLRPLAGDSVELQGFDLGAYPDASRGTTVTVRDLVTDAVLFSFNGNVGTLPANQATHFTLAGVSSANGLRIQWQDSAYNVGIDNINFSVGAVPEPGTWAMLAAGLLGLGAVARRRKPD